MTATSKFFKFQFILVLLVTLPLAFSCKEKEAKDLDVTDKVEKQEPIDQWKQITDVTQTSSTNDTIAKNPAHGQPGHRCDIPVGAPLNSPPANNTITPVQGGNTNTATGNINPPHGQAGHRCDIKVGDPLPQ